MTNSQGLPTIPEASVVWNVPCNSPEGKTLICSAHFFILFPYLIWWISERRKAPTLKRANIAHPPALVILLLAKASHKLRTVTISPGCAGASSLLFAVQESLETCLCEDMWRWSSQEQWTMVYGMVLFSEGKQRTAINNQPPSKWVKRKNQQVSNNE